MKFIITALLFFGAFCLQQKPVGIFSIAKAESFHTHTDDSFAMKELLEVIFTGHVNHVHEHNDHDDSDAHSHPHEHTSPKFVSLFDFLPETFIFSLNILKAPYPLGPSKLSLISFQSVILRPPIS